MDNDDVDLNEIADIVEAVAVTKNEVSGQVTITVVNAEAIER